MTSMITLSSANEGVKECLKNSSKFIDISKSYFANNQYDLSLLFHYFSLIEFGNIVLLRDRIQIAEYKNQKEIEISDFINDIGKKIDAAIRTAGPHVHILKILIPSSLPQSEIVPNILGYLNDFIFTKYDSTNNKWTRMESFTNVRELKDAIGILEKMIRKWNAIF